jgi:hypothetical protein
MNPAVLMYAIQALEALPQLIAAGQSVTALITQTTSSLKSMQAENRDPTAAEWVAQATTISGLRAVLHSA